MVFLMIGIIAASSIIILETQLPPIEPIDYDFISLDDCETLNNVSEPYEREYDILLDTVGCEGDYAITYATNANLSEVTVIFNITFLSNYSFIGFNFYISNATNLELLNITEPITLSVWNQTKGNGSDFAWEFDGLEVECNNLTASYDDLNITNTYISNLIFVIKSGDFVQAGAYAIDNIYVLKEI